MTPKKRGAQAGNQNATKHGLYSKAFRVEALTIEQLDSLAQNNLVDEIALLRYLLTRYLEKQVDKTDEDRGETMERSSAITTRIATMLRMNEAIAKKSDDIEAVIAEALHEAINEIRANYRRGS